jgi:hypothetical protein
MAKRRRRRSAAQLVAQRTLVEIKAKRLAFLREVSTLLSDALGFTVKVSLARADARSSADYTPAMRRAARLSKKDARRQMREAFAPLDDTHFPHEEPE